MDVIRRILEHFEPHLKVRQVMGITDVDDKIIARAGIAGATFSDVSRAYERNFIKDLRALNVPFAIYYLPWVSSQHR